MATDPAKTYANPFNICAQCRRRVSWGDTDTEGRFRNEPCGHAADFKSVCPSWGPVDGCQCVEILGSRDHGDPQYPEETRDER